MFFMHSSYDVLKCCDRLQTCKSEQAWSKAQALETELMSARMLETQQIYEVISTERTQRKVEQIAFGS